MALRSYIIQSQVPPDLHEAYQGIQSIVWVERDVMTVSFTLESPDLSALSDPQEVAVRLVGVFEDGEDEAEWAALPFLYVLAYLSFDDARPRGRSGSEFDPLDGLDLDDFLPHLRYNRQGLEWHGDYIKGRRIKTELRVNVDGRVEVQTWERGEAATRWLRRLQGKTNLQVAATESAPSGI